jgi:hypothetical protein
VPIGGLIRLRVPAVAELSPWPNCVPDEVALPTPKPEVLLFVPPVEPVDEVAVPPENGVENEAAVAPVVLVLNWCALNVPRVELAELPPVTADPELALATCAEAMPEAARMARAMRVFFMMVPKAKRVEDRSSAAVVFKVPGLPSANTRNRATHCLLRRRYEV